MTCLELSDVQDKPLLWSTFMMWMLAELYHNLPEAGDLPKPKLVFFFDEAHLLFDDASKAFLDQVQQVVRLIRSKGVGVYFVTQTPKDVPERRAGAARQPGPARAPRPHARRRYGARATVRTFPKTTFYDLEETLTSLGIGEAVVTVLDARGAPTPVVATRLIPPVLADGAAHPRGAAGGHPPVGLAGRVRPGGGPRERARDAGRAHGSHPGAGTCRARAGRRPTPPAPPAKKGRAAKTVAQVAGGALVGALSSTIGRTVGREIIRGVFGLLGAKPPRATTTRRSRW